MKGAGDTVRPEQHRVPDADTALVNRAREHAAHPLDIERVVDVHLHAPLVRGLPHPQARQTAEKPAKHVQALACGVEKGQRRDA